MKRILSLILMLAVGVPTLMAQPSGRSVKTVVADVAARMPAQGETEYVKLMVDLTSTGAEGVAVLGDMFTSVNDAAVNFALYGWAQYVTREGNEDARRVFSKAIAKEVNESSDVEIKKHYIRLLEVAGGDEIVPAVQKWISDEALQATAASCLIAINSTDSKAALVAEIDNCDKEIMAYAIGECGIMGYETKLIEWLEAADVALEGSIFFALAHTGGLESVSTLKTAAKLAGYDFEKSSATADYVTLLKRAAKSGAEYAYKEAKSLYGASKKAGETQTMIAAIEIMCFADDSNANELVINSVINSDNKNFRNGVLEMARLYATEELFAGLANEIDNVDVQTKIDIINFLGVNEAKSGLNYIFKYIGADDVELAVCAMLSAARIDGSDELVGILGDRMVNSTDEKVIDGAGLALTYLDYGVNNAAELSDELIQVVINGSSYAQIRAMELLAAKKANNAASIVIEKLNATDKKTSTAAYKALASVVGKAQLKELLQILVNAPAENIVDVQDAMVAAVTQLPAPSRVAKVKEMMAQEGDKKALFYSILARLGDDSVLGIIAETFAQSTDAEKVLALETLKNWNGEQVFPLLASIAEISSDKYRDQVWTIYLNQIGSQRMTLENRRLFATNVLYKSDNAKLQAGAINLIGNTKSYAGMMTVAPYMDFFEKIIIEAACQAVQKIALGNSTYCGAEVVALLNKCIAKLDNPDAGYQKEAIKKHLSKLATTGGYVALFNGKDMTGWKGLVANPIARQKMSPKVLAEKQVLADKVMNNSWSVKDGCLYFNGKGDNICTVDKYGDFEMIVDWRLYKEGTEADAGIYLRGTPQVQMWDISRTNVGAQVGSGGLYNNSKNPSKPSQVSDNELGEWNTLFIKMVGERVTVLLNGEKVVDNVILENYWNRAIPIFTEEQIELQAHGCRVEYRNIYLRELEAVKPLTLSADEQKDGFKLLFDGISMSEWVGDTKNYVSEGGAIVMYPAGHGGNLYTKDEYANFVLRFDFWLTPGANSGLGIRTAQGVDAAYHGMELQILDDDAPIYAALEKYQYHGSVYGIDIPKRGFLKKNGEWNTQEVIADGNRIKVILNGEVITDVDIAEASKNNTKTLDGKSHPGLLNKSGYIGFLGHGSHVKFKNIRIKTLPATR